MFRALQEPLSTWVNADWKVKYNRNFTLRIAVTFLRK